MQLLRIAERTWGERGFLTPAGADEVEPSTGADPWPTIDIEAGHPASGALEGLWGNSIAGVRIWNALPVGAMNAHEAGEHGTGADGANICTAVETALGVKVGAHPGAATSRPTIAGLHCFPSGLRVDRASLGPATPQGSGKGMLHLTIVANTGPSASRRIRVYRRPLRTSDTVWRVPGSDTFDTRLVAGAPSCSWVLPKGAIHIVNSTLPYVVEAGDSVPAALTLGLFITLRDAGSAFAPIS